MTWFFGGLCLGLLLNRQSKKPLLRFPLACWFLGHEWSGEEGYDVCNYCRLLGDGAGGRFHNTFWTE
jgi:hypothetical protein